MVGKLSRRGVLGSGLTPAAPALAEVSCTSAAPSTPCAGAIPEPVRFLRTSWSTDPYALCSYSYLAPGRLASRARPMLAEPFARLYFAGEATSSDWPSMTHGAMTSGGRAAREVLRDGAGSVVIVGSGFAGIGCARVLTDQGVTVTVLEARDRIGGRIWTERIADMPAEMGASWIHGPQGNPMTDLLDATSDRRYRYDKDSVAGRDEAAFREMARYRDQLDEVEDPATTPISAVFPDPLLPELVYATNVAYAQEYAADIDQLAVLAENEGRELQGRDILLPDGYDRLLAQLRGDITVRTGAVVTAVMQRPGGVILTLRSGETVTADRSVITVPIGVLKAAVITFDPPLPPAKQQAIDALGAGLMDKLWLEFPKVFWNRDVDALEYYDHDNPGRWSYWLNAHKIFGKPVLLGFNSGRPARELAHASDRDIVTSAMDALRTMHS
ncbi:FAD-dependent oxidoreductase [Nocardia thailandica]|uniref:FAD-dependent oxidoreductase n=1 Tax=Nocardia thailandica TaxID=257275 RepID=A0ABW6PWX9_9NOCA